jgi:diguanylate cyclase (GGDEF)-like protein
MYGRAPADDQIVRVLTMDRRKAERARDFPAVRLGIAQFAIFGVLVAVLFVLPGAEQAHRTLALACAGLALAYAGMLYLLPAKKWLLPFFFFGSCAYIVLACVVIAATGGAESPVRPLLVFAVVYAAWFYETRQATAIIVVVTLANTMTMLYDARALDAQPFGATIILDVVLVVAGGLMIAGRGELTRLRDTARVEAKRDPLTGLANRRALLRFLETRVGGKRPGDHFGLVFVDLDGFKQINTEFGHAGGDAALKSAAEAIARCARPGDLVARMGGDEFALIAPGIESGALQALGERVVRAVHESVNDLGLEGGRVELGASAGTAMLPDDAETIHDLLEAADHALRSAKRTGKARVVSAAQEAHAAPMPSADADRVGALS